MLLILALWIPNFKDTSQHRWGGGWEWNKVTEIFDRPSKAMKTVQHFGMLWRPTPKLFILIVIAAPYLFFWGFSLQVSHVQPLLGACRCDEICQVPSTGRRDICPACRGRQHGWLLGGWEVTFLKQTSNLKDPWGAPTMEKKVETFPLEAETLQGRLCITFELALRRNTGTGPGRKMNAFLASRQYDPRYWVYPGKPKVLAVVHHLCPSTRSWPSKGVSVTSGHDLHIGVATSDFVCQLWKYVYHTNALAHSTSTSY